MKQLRDQQNGNKVLQTLFLALGIKPNSLTCTCPASPFSTGTSPGELPGQYLSLAPPSAISAGPCLLHPITPLIFQDMSESYLSRKFLEARGRGLIPLVSYIPTAVLTLTSQHRPQSPAVITCLFVSCLVCKLHRVRTVSLLFIVMSSVISILPDTE